MSAHPRATPAFLAEHYVYELTMLRVTHALIRCSACQVLANALMESFAIHARLLMDFFANRPTGDDAVAAHFTVSGSVADPATAAIPPGVRRRLNKQVPHLTYARANADKIGPADRLMLLKAIEAGHAAFRKNVRPEFAACFAHEAKWVRVPMRPFVVPVGKPR